MVSILSADKVYGALKITDRGKEYVFDSAGELWEVVRGGHTKVTETGAINDVMRSAFNEIEAKGGKLPTEVKEILETTPISTFPKDVVSETVAKEMDAAITSANKVSAIAAKGSAMTQAEIDDVARELIKTPKAEKYLGTAAETGLREGKFDWLKMESFKNARKDLTEILKADKPAVKKIEELLVKHHGNSAHLELTASEVNALAKKGLAVDMGKIKSEIRTEVDKGIVEAEKHAKRIVDVTENLAREAKEAKPDAKKIADWNKDLTEAKTKFKEATGGKYGPKVAEGLKAKDEPLVKKLGEAQKDIGTHMDGALKNASTTIETVATKSKWYQKPISKLEEIATKKGTTVEKLSGWKKLGGGVQAGIIAGAALLIGYVVAGTGSNKGPSQTAEDKRRENAAQAAPSIA